VQFCKPAATCAKNNKGGVSKNRRKEKKGNPPKKKCKRGGKKDTVRDVATGPGLKVEVPGII